MMDYIMAVIGICGGWLCAVADCLLDLKGPDNKKLGKGGYIDSKWEEMSHWRFIASISIKTELYNRNLRKWLVSDHY